MTLKQAATIQFLWMKVSDEIYDVTAKMMAQKKLDCISVEDASEMIKLYNESDDIDKDAKSVYRKLLASWRKS